MTEELQPKPTGDRIDESARPGIVKASAPASALRLAGRLRHARLLLGFSLRQVAEAAGVTESYVSKLENCRVRPSLATLHKLASVLKTNISELVSEGDVEGRNLVVVPSERRRAFEFSDEHGGAGTSLEKLIPSRRDNLLQANIHVVAPGGGSEELISHKGQEFGFVLEGRLDLLIGDDIHRIKEGDAFFFDSEVPHGYRNTSGRIVRVVWVNTPPTF